jgi:hypothetical protein
MNLLPNIPGSIQRLKSQITRAEGDFDIWVNTGDEYADPTWLFESCFLQLFIIAEALELEEFRKLAFLEYENIKKSKDGLGTDIQTPDGEPYSAAGSILRRFLRALEPFFPEDEKTTVTKDLLDIIRDIHYVITDSVLFGSPPRDENDVHLRIEGILKSVFPSLKHKPTLTKAIKNFIPDTGIDSIGTLIEYKFLSSKDEIGSIADQVLADTRGYLSKDWNRFLYVIYETNRFRTEKEWNQLLRQSGVLENTQIVVLSGEPIAERRKRKLSNTHPDQQLRGKKQESGSRRAP